MNTYMGLTLFRKKQRSAQFWELLGFELAILVIRNGRLKWFGHVELEYKDNAYWFKHCK